MQVLTEDKGVQVSPRVFEKASSCNIQCNGPSDICPVCFSREHPSIVLSDHGYAMCELEPELKIVNSSTPVKPKASFRDDNDASISDIVSPTKSDPNDTTFNISDFSDASPVHSPVFDESDIVENETEPNVVVGDGKFIVFFKCLEMLFKLVVCKICQSPVDLDEITTHIDGSCLNVFFTCLNSHNFTWRSQPLIGKQPAGNILIAAATLITGNTYSILNFGDSLNLNFIGRSSFFFFLE